MNDCVSSIQLFKQHDSRHFMSQRQTRKTPALAGSGCKFGRDAIWPTYDERHFLRSTVSPTFNLFRKFRRSPLNSFRIQEYVYGALMQPVCDAPRQTMPLCSAERGFHEIPNHTSRSVTAFQVSIYYAIDEHLGAFQSKSLAAAWVKKGEG